MMSYGLQTAFGEITLVLFTALAPSGVMAYVILAVLLLRQPGWVNAQRLQHVLCLPLMVGTVGLIASATHLGSPSNALYVFLGVGRSPLSNEVFSAVVFLFLAGAYWLYSFSLRQRLWIQRVWLCLTVVSGVVFITFIAFAYAVPTIISWHTAFTPVNLWLDALVGGPMLALLSLQLAKTVEPASVAVKVLLAVSLIAATAKFVTLMIQATTLGAVENSVTTAAALVPYASLVTVLFGILSLTALVIYGRKIKVGKLPPVYQSTVACIAVGLGLLLTRFMFYAMHMTTGLSL